jgi:hypothetical protein
MIQELTLSLQEYESLVALAREGARLKGTIRAFETDPTLRTLWEKARTQYGWDPNLIRDLEAFLKVIEEHNGVSRYFVALRWTEAGEPLPARVAGAPTRFPENWPPVLEGTIELFSRAVARADADAYLQARAKQPLNVMCTYDVGRRVGWTPLDAFFR